MVKDENGGRISRSLLRDSPPARLIAGFWEKAGAWTLPRDASGEGYGVLFRRRPASLAFCLFFVFASSFGQTFFLSLFQPGWRDTLQLSPAEMGAIYGGATLLSGLLMPIGGRWIDRASPRTAAVFVLAGLACCALLASRINSVWMLAATLFGLRLFGQGLSSNLGVSCAAKWFDRNRGKALSIAGLGFPLGEAVLPISATWALAVLAPAGTWLLVSAGCVVLGLPVALLLLRRAGETAAPPDQRGPTVQSSSGDARLLRSTRFYLMLAVVAPLPFIGTGLIFFQAILADSRGWGASVFPTGFVLFAFVRAAFSLSAGAWCDRIGPMRLLPVSALSLGFALVWLLHPHPAFAYVFFLFMGLSFGASGAVTTAAWTEMFGKERIGAIRGLSSSVAIFLTAAAPFVFGLALDSGASTDHIIAGCVLLLLMVAWPASVALRRLHPRGLPSA